MENTMKDETFTLIEHCAEWGIQRTIVRDFQISKPHPFEEYPVAVSIRYVRPFKRKGSIIVVASDNVRYVTIEQQGGGLFYDSRRDVPFDMAAWREAYTKNRAKWLERQAEIDRLNAAHGGRSEQICDFSFDASLFGDYR